ncbi:protein of unknown function [Burkholderia multivorans]
MTYNQSRAEVRPKERDDEGSLVVRVVGGMAGVDAGSCVRFVQPGQRQRHVVQPFRPPAGPGRLLIGSAGGHGQSCPFFLFKLIPASS